MASIGLLQSATSTSVMSKTEGLGTKLGNYTRTAGCVGRVATRIVRLQNGQVKGKVENEDEQSRIVQSSNQKSSPRVRLLTAEASSNDGRQSSNLSTLLEEVEQIGT